MPASNWRKDKGLATVTPLTREELARLCYVLTGKMARSHHTKDDLILVLRRLVT